MLKLEYYSKWIEPRSTNSDPSKYELQLEAIGNYGEIEWLKKQINKIGKTNNKKDIKNGRELLQK